MNLVRIEAVSTDRMPVTTIVIANPPVNALSAPVRAGLLAAIVAADADCDTKAIVIAAEGKAFIAGADISEFGKPPQAPTLPEVLAAIERCRKPVVAAIQGIALGGGLELALACHGRIAAPQARLGLPEITLGLIPGAGGTQRLPRLLGAAAAFRMMARGDAVGATEALSLGLLEAVAQENLLEVTRTHALSLSASGPLPRVRDRADRLTPEDRAAFEADAAAAQRRAPDRPNVAALAACVRAGLDLPFEQGLALERARFAALIDDPRSQALRHVFFAERAAARISGVDREVRPRAVDRAAVIGAGTMGGGIAMCFAQAGIPVTLIEARPEALDAGIARIHASYAAAAQRGTLDHPTMERHLGLITPHLGLDGTTAADIVVEAAFEDMDVKTAIFSALDMATRPGTILATNTSYLDVNAIAASTRRPGDVVGLHFFSPAHVMRLLEVVRGASTAPDVLVTAAELGRRLGKLPVVVGACHGFVGNRILARRTLAAERLLLAGALPHEVDAAVTGFGFRMGPFAMADLAGLDIGWRARKAIGARAPVADALAEQGRFGQKSGRGFYLYAEGSRAGARDPETEALIAALSRESGIIRRSFTPDEILARLFYPMVNEGAKILEEGIAARAGDIDVIWLNGYNWPASTGGPMYWAQSVGLPRIVEALDLFAAETGDETLRPTALLKRVAAEGGAFPA